MFDKMKQLYDLQKHARSAKQAAGDQKIERQAAEGKIRVTVNGRFEVENVEIDESLLAPAHRATLEKGLADAFTEAAAEAARSATSQAMDLMKKMGIKVPGL